MPSLLDRAKAVPDMLRRLPVIGTGMAVNARYGANAGGQFSASIAFFGFLSLFPLLLVSMSVAGFLLRDPALQAEWIQRLSEAVPGLSTAFGESITSLVSHRATSGIVGLVGLVWTGMRVIESTSVATNRVFGVDAASNIIKDKSRALVALVALGGLTLVTVGIAGAVGAVKAEGVAGGVLRGFGFVLSFVLDTMLFVAAYRLVTSGKGPGWRKLVPGALLGGFGWTLLKVGGSVYVRNNVANASAIYGTFASIVGALLLLYLAARLYLYGAELNALLIERAGQPKEEALYEDESHEETEARVEEEAVAAAEQRDATEDPQRPRTDAPVS